jgi:hypothetical protein
MNKEQWIWMRASVALMAAAAGVMKHAAGVPTLAEHTRALPQTVATP